MPYYDFDCPEHGVTEVKLGMAQAGDAAPCPECGVAMRRLYDTRGAIIMRPWGYSLPMGHPDYWRGYTAPVAEKLGWQRGSGPNRAGEKPSPQYEGTGALPYKA